MPTMNGNAPEQSAQHTGHRDFECADFESPGDEQQQQSHADIAARTDSEVDRPETSFGVTTMMPQERGIVDDDDDGHSAECSTADSFTDNPPTPSPFARDELLHAAADEEGDEAIVRVLEEGRKPPPPPLPQGSVDLKTSDGKSDKGVSLTVPATMATTATAPSAMALPVDSSTAREGESFPAKVDPAVIDGKHESEEIPLFSFGAIADVQYADCEDGWNFHQTYKRYYRGGLQQLKRAVDVWLRDESHTFALQLGDVIDGCNRHGNSEAALQSVKREIDRLAEGLPLGVLNSLGNHELYNFPKQRWAREVDCSSRAKAATSRPSSTCAGSSFDRVSLAPPRPVREAGASASQDSAHHSGDAACAEERFYYSFCPDQAYRLVALDTYDVNAIRKEPQDVHEEGAEAHPHVLATDMLSERNPNEDKNDSTGLDDLGGRFVMYNGGVGAEQVKWLEEELAEASQAGQRVIVFGHVPIHPGNDMLNCLLWNYEDVLEVMHKFDCVVMYLSGHRHRETYYEDEKGVHHISLAAALEALPDQEAFASVDVYANRLELRGHGVVESRKMIIQ